MSMRACIKVFSTASLQAGCTWHGHMVSMCYSGWHKKFPMGKKGRKNIRLLRKEKWFQYDQVVNHENKHKASPGHKHKTQLIEVSKQDSSL